MTSLCVSSPQYWRSALILPAHRHRRRSRRAHCTVLTVFTRRYVRTYPRPPTHDPVVVLAAMHVAAAVSVASCPGTARILRSTTGRLLPGVKLKEAHQRLGTVPPAARASITPVSVSRVAIHLVAIPAASEQATLTREVSSSVVVCCAVVRLCCVSLATGLNVRAVARYYLAIIAPVGCSRLVRLLSWSTNTGLITGRVEIKITSG
jgi:hypothetical protein